MILVDQVDLFLPGFREILAFRVHPAFPPVQGGRVRPLGQEIHHHPVLLSVLQVPLGIAVCTEVSEALHEAAIHHMFLSPLPPGHMP